MKKIKYETIRVPKKDILNSDDSLLNYYGEQGWDLVNIIIDGNQIAVLLFKKEVK
jgi:hypothetical protein